jgi:diguanylate cyclase (GGDEF)-like protein
MSGGTLTWPYTHPLTGMAASDPDPRSDRPPHGGAAPLTASALRERLDEEIGRAERYGAGLSCLLVSFENLEEVSHQHGTELREQMLDYVAVALSNELRRFDRVGRVGDRDSNSDLLVILPGADSPRGEIVARRALERLRTIKVEVGGTRMALEVSVGLAAWRKDVSAEALLELARAAIDSPAGENGASGSTPALQTFGAHDERATTDADTASASARATRQ